MLWGCVLSFSLLGMGFLSSQSWRRFANDPTVIAIERDYQNWNTSLPSSVLCPSTKYTEPKLDAYMDTLPRDDKWNATKRFLMELSNVSYTSLSENTVNYNLLDGNAVNIRPQDYMKILYQIAFELDREPNINSTLWDLNYNITITERGYCYGLNSLITAYNNPAFFFLRKAYKPEGTTKVMHGIPIGGHLQYSVTQINDEVTVSYVANNDVPDIASASSVTHKGDFSFFDFSAQSTLCSEEVKELTVQQRRCRFLDESPLDISIAYSYNWCRMNCRWHLARKLCGCVPHFYRYIDGVKICDRDGLRCIQEHTLTLKELRNLTTNEKVGCLCLPTCEDTIYIVEDQQEIQWYNSTNVQWTLKKFPKIRYRRELIFGFSDLLISIGGLAGLFLGCSVLSFTEIPYFFSIQLCIRIYSYCKKQKAAVREI